MSKDTVIARQAIEGSRERRREEAARWFVTLQQAELSARVLKSWKKWESVPENREAFDVVERVWRLADSLPPPPVPSPREQATDHYDGSTSVLSWSLTHTSKAARAPRHRLLAGVLGLAAAIVVAVVGLRWIAPEYFEAASPDGRHVSAETDVAEHKELVIEDGTRIYLGAQTLVTTSFTEHARTVVLHRGEALFEVAKDHRRPFRVNAGRGNITAVGTAFHVRRRADDQVVVTVTEGVVEVSPTPTVEEVTNRPAASDDNEPRATQRLTRGQEVSFDPRGRLSPIRIAETDISATWRDGRLTYRSEPLRHVIQDVNRYSRRQVILGDVATGDLLYSGTVFERDIDDWIAALEKIYPEIEVVTTDDRHILIRARSETAVSL